MSTEDKINLRNALGMLWATLALNKFHPKQINPTEP